MVALSMEYCAHSVDGLNFSEISRKYDINMSCEKEDSSFDFIQVIKVSYRAMYLSLDCGGNEASSFDSAES